MHIHISDVHHLRGHWGHGFSSLTLTSGKRHEVAGGNLICKEINWAYQHCSQFPMATEKFLLYFCWHLDVGFWNFAHFTWPKNRRDQPSRFPKVGSRGPNSGEFRAGKGWIWTCCHLRPQNVNNFVGIGATSGGKPPVHAEGELCRKHKVLKSRYFSELLGGKWESKSFQSFQISVKNQMI